jgi:hypothetical protein
LLADFSPSKDFVSPTLTGLIPFQHFRFYEFGFVSFLRILLDEVRKKEQFKNKKHNKELDQNH